MSDYYTEQLIKKQTSMKDICIKALLVSAAIVSVLVVFLFPLGILIPVVVIAVVAILFRRLDVEYEYLYVNGDLDIDKIMHKAKRKRVFSMNVHDLELLAPAESGELRQYQRAKTYDYSSGSGQGRLYALIVTDHGQQKKILFEPNETIIEGFYLLAPRKVARR